MDVLKRFTGWLERRWVNPAYVGWVLLGLALFFFAAATNTLAGWLYVMSGVMLALLLVAAVLPPRNLQGLVVTRSPIQPVTAGVPLEVELRVQNPQRQTKSLFQIIDLLPADLGAVQTTAVDILTPGQTHRWRYQVPTPRRGIYRWQTADLRTAAPLGLFWCRRSTEVPATAVVYPPVLPLRRCPILDTVGPQGGQHWRYSPQAQADTQGVTRSLRPYRWGDPTRLIHWRTSARYGELRVRELETMTASRDIIIALNTAARWPGESFEQAVIGAASLYSYALKQGFSAALWLPQEEVLRESSQVMYALAAVNPAATSDRTSLPPQTTIVWLTAAGAQPPVLAANSRQLVWGSGDAAGTLYIDSERSLELQLQTSMP